jgi:hypothetical protein
MSRLTAFYSLRKTFSGEIPDGVEPGGERFLKDNKIIPIGRMVVDKGK